MVYSYKIFEPSKSIEILLKSQTGVTAKFRKNNEKYIINFKNLILIFLISSSI